MALDDVFLATYFGKYDSAGNNPAKRKRSSAASENAKCSCPHACWQRFPRECRRKLFDAKCALSPAGLGEFLAKHIIVTPAPESSITYFLPGKGAPEQVCRETFMSIMQVTEKQIFRAFEKKQRVEPEATKEVLSQEVTFAPVEVDDEEDFLGFEDVVQLSAPVVNSWPVDRLSTASSPIQECEDDASVLENGLDMGGDFFDLETDIEDQQLSEKDEEKDNSNESWNDHPQKSARLETPCLKSQREQDMCPPEADQRMADHLGSMPCSQNNEHLSSPDGQEDDVVDVDSEMNEGHNQPLSDMEPLINKELAADTTNDENVKDPASENRCRNGSTKQVKPACNCKMKCDERVPIRERERMLQELRKLPRIEQWRSLGKLIEVTPVNKNPEDGQYILEVGTTTVTVCQHMFQATFKLKKKQLLHVIAKRDQLLRTSNNSTAAPDEPPTQDPTHLLVQHVASFATHTTHLCPESSQVKKLLYCPNVAFMYNQYMEQCRSSALEPADFGTYFTEFNRQFVEQSLALPIRCDDCQFFEDARHQAPVEREKLNGKRSSVESADEDMDSLASGWS